MLKDRTHFARINTGAQVQQSLNALEELCPGQIAGLTKGSVATGFVQVFAPDGDCVFAALEKAPDVWACRFHREVFDEDPAETVR